MKMRGWMEIGIVQDKWKLLYRITPQVMEIWKYHFLCLALNYDEIWISSKDRGGYTVHDSTVECSTGRCRKLLNINKRL